jgi:hypothetical protein
MANTNITTSELDFDAIKLNLKNFLKGQDAFKDYDFEGAGLSVLIDLLAYNTHYNALYTNLAINESFLDSASKRSSVVSRAKEIGYIPRSVTCPKAVVSVKVTPSTILNLPATINMLAYQPFTTSVDGTQFTFYNQSAVSATLDLETNTFTFDNMEIMEGSPLYYKYTVAEGTKYILPNVDIDLKSLVVRVADNATTSNRTTFVNQEDLLNIDSTSACYFVKEIEGQYYELEFGNGVIGKALSNGNIVEIYYMTTSKALANGAKVFTYGGATMIAGSVGVTTITEALEGGEAEDITSIRYNAPRAYTAQNRAVTVEDYKANVYRLFSEAQTVNVWGGEDATPPVYGKVYIAIKPKSSEYLTPTQKEFIKSQLLKSRNTVTISPEIVDPEYILLAVTTSVYYNPRLTSKTASEIKDIVTQAIRSYNTSNLNSFSGVLKFSKLTTAIDAADPSIVSNITTLKLHREIKPSYGVATTYNIELGNPIYGSGVPEQSFISTGFYVPESPYIMYIEDQPLDYTHGLVRLYYFDDAGTKTYYQTIGTADAPCINYKTGSISIPNLTISGLDLTAQTVGEWIIKPQSNDVISVRNQLITIPDERIYTSSVVDQVAAGDSGGNSNYVFTSSRN